jgi:spore maturation protein CgeB
VAAGVDVAFTNERSCVPFLQNYNRWTYYLPHGYDPARHSPSLPAGEADVHAHDVVFVGTGFAERVALLEAVDWSGIDLGLYGAWSLVAEDSPLRPYIQSGIVPNVEAARLYRAAKIGLNLYRRSYGYDLNAPQINTGESLNPRALELAANGVFTISDGRPEQAEVFGDVVPTFETAAELEWLVRHYLTHDADRTAKARQLPALVADRTFDNVARQLLTVLED